MNLDDEAAFKQQLDALEARVRRARRWMAAGAALGLLIGLALTLALLGQDTAEPSDVVILIAIAFTISGLAATAAHLIAGGRLQKPLNDTAGYDLAADRIKAAVRGDTIDLSPTEQRRAARYAAIASIALPALNLRWSVLLAGVLIIQATRLAVSATNVGQPASLLVAAGLALAAALIGIYVIPQRLRAIKQTRAYTHAHPWTTAP